MKRCLYCYQTLETVSVDFHPACSKKIFGTTTTPELPYASGDMIALGTKVIQSQFSITGAQPKLSLDIEKAPSEKHGKFTIVGLWGNYILKPPSEKYIQLPEVEDLTMHLASIARIAVVPHSLIRMKDGKLAYITRRIDRQKKRNTIIKIHMEDMCQLTERLTEDKYNGSYEQIAKVIWNHSSQPVLDIINFYEQVLFSFLTGNADMHLKNFSLLNTIQGEYKLTPAYDLVSTALVMPEDKEDLALHLNGRKRKLNRIDFITAFNGSGLAEKQKLNIFNKMFDKKNQWFSFIDTSFLNPELKTEYKATIEERFKRLKP